MPEIKVSQLPRTTTLSSGSQDDIMIIQGGVNKVMALNELFLSVKSDMIINPLKGATNFTVNGQVFDNLIATDAVNNRVGIGTNTPSERLQVLGNLQLGSDLVGSNLYLSAEDITVSVLGSAITLNSSHIVSNLITSDNVLASGNASSPLMDMDLANPIKKHQLKMIVLGDTSPTRSVGLSYKLNPINILGVTNNIVFTKRGDSLTLKSVYTDQLGLQWMVIGSYGLSIT
jgi:hypothetical protein